MKKYKQFITERSGYNQVMEISDLIYVMEQENPNNVIIDMNHELANKNRNEGEIWYIISGFIKLDTEGMNMESRSHTIKYGGEKDMYSYEIESRPEYLMGRTGNFDNSKELPSETNFPPHKTIGELIQEAKQLNPKGLFFIREQPIGYNAPSYDNCFGVPISLATYNVSSYPLTKNGEIVSGKLGKDFDFSKSGQKAHMNMFMGIGQESGGVYTLQQK